MLRVESARSLGPSTTGTYAFGFSPNGIVCHDLAFMSWNGDVYMNLVAAAIKADEEENEKRVNDMIKLTPGKTLDDCPMDDFCRAKILSRASGRIKRPTIFITAVACRRQTWKVKLVICLQLSRTAAIMPLRIYTLWWQCQIWLLSWWLIGK